MAEFTYLPSRGFSQEVTPRVTTAKFGDGYSQRTLYGINTVGYTWNLTFQSQPLDTANLIIAFFEAKQGATAFTWRPTGESEDVKVICSKWNKTYDTEISRTITATFERVYE